MADRLYSDRNQGPALPKSLVRHFRERNMTMNLVNTLEAAALELAAAKCTCLARDLALAGRPVNHGRRCPGKEAGAKYLRTVRQARRFMGW